MAFTVRKLAYRPWPVTVALFEADDAGNVSEVKNTFVAHFKPFTEDEFEALRQAANAAHPAAPDSLAPDPDENTPMPIVLRRNADLFCGVIVGWGPEVRDEHGVPLPFSPAALSALVTGPDGAAVSVGIHKAIVQIRFGAAPEKNVETSPAPGPIPSAGGAAPTS